MIAELLLFSSLAFILLMPLIGDSPNDVLGEAAERMRRQRMGGRPTKHRVLVRDVLFAGRRQLPVGNSIQHNDRVVALTWSRLNPARNRGRQSGNATARGGARKR